MPINLPYHIYRFAAKEQFFPFFDHKKGCPKFGHFKISFTSMQ